MQIKEVLSKITSKVNIELIDQHMKQQNKRLVYTSFDGDYMHFMQDMIGVCLYNNYIPVNPEAALGYYISTQSHDGKKIPVMKDCMNTELLCDEMWIFVEESGKIPEGVLAEILLWDRERKNKIMRVPFFCGLDTKYRICWKNMKEIDMTILSNRDILEIVEKRNQLDIKEIDEKLLNKCEEKRENAYIIANFYNYKHIDWARVYCYRNNICPISPQNILPYCTYKNIYKNYQEHYLNDRLTILDKTDKVIWFTSLKNIDDELERLDIYSSSELYYAHRIGKTIDWVDWEDAEVPKYMKKNSWAITTTERKEVM